MIEIKVNHGEASVSINGTSANCALIQYASLRASIKDGITEKSKIHGALYEQAMRDCLINLAFDLDAKSEKKEAEKKEAPEKKEDDPLDGIMAIIKAIMEA